MLDFKTEVVTGIVLHAADALTVNRALTPGGANEIVTVSSTDCPTSTWKTHPPL